MLLLKSLGFVILLCCTLEIKCCSKVTFVNNRIMISRKTDNEPIVSVKVTGCITPEIIAEQLGQVSVTRIICSNQTIPIFHEKAVSNLPDLEQLVIKDSTIQRIKQNAFYNLPGLRSLLINGNHINIIDRNAFLNLDLHTLHLSGNKVEYLEPGMFANLSRLMYLELKYNQLETFQPEWFTDSYKLDTVDISHNLIRTVQRNTFKLFTKLQNIDLSYNRIKYIHKDAFEGLEELKFLYLHNNRIENLEEGIFRSLKSITVMWLHGNNLTYVSDLNLQDMNSIVMEEVTINTNPWQCACYQKILQWVHENGIHLYLKTSCYDGNTPVCVVSKENQELCMEVWEDDIYKVFHKYGQNYLECLEKEA